MQKTILVIDDNADMRLLLKMYLETEGYVVETAKEGSDALNRFQQGLRPCLVLLDMIMDGMGGEDFLTEFERKLPQVYADTPIVITSAMDNVPLEKVSGFLPKPVDVDSLVHTIEAHCG